MRLHVPSQVVGIMSGKGAEAAGEASLSLGPWGPHWHHLQSSSHAAPTRACCQPTALPSSSSCPQFRQVQGNSSSGSGSGPVPHRPSLHPAAAHSPAGNWHRLVTHGGSDLKQQGICGDNETWAMNAGTPRPPTHVPGSLVLAFYLRIRRGTVSPPALWDWEAGPGRGAQQRKPQVGQGRSGGLAVR